MRNLEGKLMWERVRPFLFAILLFLPLSATFCHAQCWNDMSHYSYLPGLTMTPRVWTAGQTYTVTVSDSNPSEGNFVQGSGYPWCNALVGPANGYNPDGSPNVSSLDPNVTMNNLTYIDSTSISFTVTLGPNANAKNDYWVLRSMDNWIYIPLRFWASATNLGRDNSCENQAKQMSGDAINITNGNVWIQHRDYSVPGLGGGLELVRTWNSLYGTAAVP
jgi:hypothetical protein